MKKSYQRLLIFEIILFVIFFINSFVWNILSNYNMIIFLVIMTILFKFFIGFEKDNHRYVKDIIINLFILLLISFIIYYLSGILIGFYRISNYLNFYGIKTFILPVILSIVVKEYLRYQMLNKAENSKLFIAITTLAFSFLDISNAFNYESFATSYDIFLFIALFVLPSLSTNAACSYIAIKTGYKPNIMWLLFVKLYVYLIPIVPNPNEYILSLIRVIFPLIMMTNVYMFFDNRKDFYIERDYKKKRVLVVILPILLIVLIIYLTCGYFHYYAIAIASGSMSPKINKGDVVIIEKLDGGYDSLKVGDVLAYRYKDVIIVHRIINIIKDNDVYYFYTKGDANSSVDNYSIKEDMVIGIVNHKISYLGIPTVWLNEL